jgi:hypothetical protein
MSSIAAVSAIAIDEEKPFGEEGIRAAEEFEWVLSDEDVQVAVAVE